MTLQKIGKSRDTMYASKAKLTVWFLGDKNLNIRVNIVLKGKISQKNFEKKKNIQTSIRGITKHVFSGTYF